MLLMSDLQDYKYVKYMYIREEVSYRKIRAKLVHKIIDSHHAYRYNLLAVAKIERCWCPSWASC